VNEVSSEVPQGEDEHQDKWEENQDQDQDQDQDQNQDQDQDGEELLAPSVTVIDPKSALEMIRRRRSEALEAEKAVKEFQKQEEEMKKHQEEVTTRLPFAIDRAVDSGVDGASTSVGSAMSSPSVEPPERTEQMELTEQYGGPRLDSASVPIEDWLEKMARAQP